ncbi:NfeD family protein [Pengzhenrongella sicca]|uniref:NfeD family protein n=1 Tax=Pengzhenrongella sicca TaxID=2819238 RepID=A0A8A4ZFS3_9MICO|nr:NfeD family protein [Pengzhenrongella sicca]QTE30744.1 NfeD family protein [Pengzhenrongella sicca]
MDPLWWIGAGLVFVVIEILTLGFVLIMFAGGAFAAALASALGAPTWLQFVVFAAASVLLLFALRPWLLRRLKRRMPLEETNVAAQLGRSAMVVADVGPLGGRIKLSGEVWSARAARDGLVFPEGAEVQVVRIDGATAVVDAVARDSAPSTSTTHDSNPHS